MSGFLRALRIAAAVLVAVGVAWLAASRWVQHELAVERRALEARAGELTQRVLAAGSPLACLDAVANATLEVACEKTIYASPETTAAAVAYIDAKLSLLADSLAYAARDPAYTPRIERLRRGLERDRYGIVAQALAARGCTPESCPALKLLRNSERVALNMRERTFDANVVLHAGVWRPESTALAAAPPAERTPPAPAAATATVPSKYEFPSAASIPPVSIMDPEPPLSKQEQAAIGPPVAAAPPAAAPAARPQPQAQPAARPRPAGNVPLPPPAPAR